jgi:hypothetical protein
MRHALLATLIAAALASPTLAATLGGPLELSDEGSFFIGGQAVTTNFADAPASGAPPQGLVSVGQMYVQFRIPKTITGPAIIMVHGANHTGVTYETTPDGREGWATYFTRKGHPTYVVDHAGRGRSGFDATALNRGRVENAPASQPGLSMATRQRSYPNFRIGKEYPTPYANSRFPVEAQDQYFKQLVPNTETTLSGAGANTVEALALLLDRIGPAVVMVHSQSGLYGIDLIRKRAPKMRALVSIEGGCAPVSTEDAQGTLKSVPILSVWGDNSVGAVGFNGDERREGCVSTLKAVNAAGGKGTFMLLPERGMSGNSHMMMMDKNNLEIADLVMGWIGANARKE